MNTKLSYSVVCSEILTDIDRILTFEVNVLLSREEVTGDWQKLHIGELYGIYCLLNFIGTVK